MRHTLFAEQPAEGPPNPLASPLFLMMIGVMFLFVFLMPLMNRRQKREQEAMLASIKRGTKVLTNAGIVGVIVSAKDGEDEIVIKSEETRFRITRGAVFKILGSDETEAAKG